MRTLFVVTIPLAFLWWAAAVITPELGSARTEADACPPDEPGRASVCDSWTTYESLGDSAVFLPTFVTYLVLEPASIRFEDSWPNHLMAAPLYTFLVVGLPWLATDLVARRPTQAP